MTKKSPLDSVPHVEKVLRALGEADPARPAIRAVVRRELAALRAKNIAPGFDELLAASRSALDSLRASRIQPVINGTGVLIHPDVDTRPSGVRSRKRSRASRRTTRIWNSTPLTTVKPAAPRFWNTIWPCSAARKRQPW